MDFKKNVQDEILDLMKNLKPLKAKDLGSNAKDFIDDSTKVAGFSRITKPGMTP